jgi:putative oxidoreductase
MFLCRWCIRRFESQGAFILSAEMAVAYFKFHAPQGFWPLLNDGEGAVLYCFIFQYLASTGRGPWGFDRRLRKRASTVC